MFTDEHALDYTSPQLWDDYDDNLFDLETVNDDTYDDPFDSKEEKIKDSKILIDELDLPGSIIKILESPMETFPCSYGEDIRVLDVPMTPFQYTLTSSSNGGITGQAKWT
ncbi:hypothetical protein Tco_1568455 [Tanacetum coccineum]